MNTQLNRKLCVLSVCLLLAASIFAQQNASKISGTVNNGEAPLNGVTVSLFKAKDSSLSKITSTIKTGQFEFDVQEAGRYFIKFSSVGFADKFLPDFDINTGSNVDLGAQSMQVASKTLNTVVVNARKPLIEIKADKIVFNVENSVNAVGNNALELLQKSPGVTVSNNDNISIKGKSGVLVYVDGRPTYLGATELVEYLRSMSSSNIEAIEIISNPSSKYDAAGSAGVINIRLKKNQKVGFNGSVTLGLIQGVTPKTNNSFNLNYRNKRVSWFGLYNNSFSLYEKSLTGTRIQNDSSYEMNNMNFNNRKTHFFKTGLDIALDAQNKHTLGIMATGNFFDGDWNNAGISYIRGANNHQLGSILESKNNILTSSNNLTLNLNYKYADTSGRVLNIDLVRGFYDGKGSSFQPNTYKDPNNGQVTLIRNFSNRMPVDIDIYTAKIDYEIPLKKSRLELGVKTSYVGSDNVFEFYNEYPSKELDINRSNRFKYKENIYAAYTNYNIAATQKLNIQAGLRAEQTSSTGDLARYNQSTSKDDHVERDYLDFFPSTAITLKLNDKNTLNFTYSRRIDRPSYQDLNPFENKLDELSYDKGNAFLRPQYSNNFELTHSFRGAINTSVNYTIVDNFIAVVNDTLDGKAVVITPQNLNKQEVYGIVFSAYQQFTKWMGVYLYSNFNRRTLQSSISPGKTVNLKVNGFTTYLQTNFDLGKGYSTELVGWIISGGMWGIFKQTAYGSCDIGFQKRLFNGKGNLKVSFNDIFFTTPSRYTSTMGGSYMTFRAASENRSVRLAFTWRFGRTEVKGARDRKTGSETEAGRIKEG